VELKTLVYLNLAINVLTIKVVVGYLVYTNNRLEVKLARTFWFNKPHTITFTWWALPYKKARSNSGKVIFRIPFRNRSKLEDEDTELFWEKRRKQRGEHKENL
jgi:hypothetical protein